MGVVAPLFVGAGTSATVVVRMGVTFNPKPATSGARASSTEEVATARRSRASRDGPETEDVSPQPEVPHRRAKSGRVLRTFPT